MAEQWISLSKALELAGEAETLFSRLRAGLVIGRAEVLITNGGRCENCVVRAEVWASAEEYIVQDLAAGDLSSPVNDHCGFQAFGVTVALTGVLGLFEFHQRAAVARALSVASDADWIPAFQVNDMAQMKSTSRPFDVGAAILDQARLGFVAARAVLAQAKVYANSSWQWEEREWDIPGWFWTNFTIATGNTILTTKCFSARGLSPSGECSILLHELHFCRKSLEAVPELKPTWDTKGSTARGRPPKYDWEAASSTVWGRIYRGDLKPKKLMAVEEALLEFFDERKQEPSEGLVREHANLIWVEMKRD